LPSAALCLPDVLLAGTSLSAVLRAAGTTKPTSLAALPLLGHVLGPRAALPSDLVFVNVKGLRAWLLAHSEVTTNWIASQKGLSASAANGELERLLRLLELADTAVAAVTLAEDDISVTLAATAEK
jgi:hypothetical protein